MTSIPNTPAATPTHSQIVFYQRADGSPDVEVRLEDETVWLTQQQIAELFDSSRTNIVEHIQHVYQEGELQESATCRKFRQVRSEGNRQVTRELPYYNLDVIISVGYRVKSSVATRFRIWATQRLKDYLVQGYAINEQRLQQLGQVIQVLARSGDEIGTGIADVLAAYLPGLQLLRDYDEGTFQDVSGAEPSWQLTIEEAREVIQQLRRQFPSDQLLGNERGSALEGLIGSVYQSFGGQDLYPTVEQKAAHLLYFVIKDHPLSDGNKRTAAALFVTFLAHNNALNSDQGQPRFTNNALAATTLLVAASNPAEKDLMIDLIVRLLDVDAATSENAN
ncbi:virulence protein RhuM/Fic/DOC family protein [Pseudoclavibacter soli]|uniref:virulence protein RhuM/Fic/DOC family protein n=1 Tax=Pseudoclavibacter soli TaxID=452623 RepID=UPI0003FE2D5F|nr:virulence protein RhuM/Fic/DOC family protein [Pseudoclavibacter soli]